MPKHLGYEAKPFCLVNLKILSVFCKWVNMFSMHKLSSVAATITNGFFKNTQGTVSSFLSLSLSLFFSLLKTLQTKVKLFLNLKKKPRTPTRHHQSGFNSCLKVSNKSL